MFDCIILARAPDATARTLACLVEGVVAGAILRATLIVEKPSDDLARIADAAGCDVETSLANIAALAQTPHALVFVDGAMPLPGWSERLLSELPRRGAPGADAAWWLQPEAGADLLKLRLALWMRRQASLRNGAVVPRVRLMSTSADFRLRATGSDRILGVISARVPH